MASEKAQTFDIAETTGGKQLKGSCHIKLLFVMCMEMTILSQCNAHACAIVECANETWSDLVEMTKAGRSNELLWTRSFVKSTLRRVTK